jgi:transposase
VVLEATGTYWIELATFLEQQHFAVSVINPSRAHDFAKTLLLKPKNDQLDAQLLARLAITIKPECWTPPPQIYRELVQRLQQRADLIALRTRLRNQLHALSVCPAVPSVVGRYQALITNLDEQLKALDKEIKTVLAQEKEWAASVSLLQTITGIGRLTALWLVVVTLNFSLCLKAESLVHFAGLAPIERKSGSSVRGRPMIGHGGNGPLRALLYMAAGSAIRFNPAIKTYYQELRTTKGKAYKVARCAVARKLLHLAFAVVTKGQPFDPEYALKVRAKRLAPRLGLVG